MNLNTAIHIMKNKVKDPYAQAYLKVLDESIEDGGTVGLAKQLNYVLVNLNSWRGLEAKEVKTFVKNWVKEKLDDEYNKVTKR